MMEIRATVTPEWTSKLDEFCELASKLWVISKDNIRRETPWEAVMKIDLRSMQEYLENNIVHYPAAEQKKERKH